MCFKRVAITENERREELLTVYCPKSGNILMKCGNGTVAEVVCPKCRATIICKFKDNRVETSENKREKKENAS